MVITMGSLRLKLFWHVGYVHHAGYTSLKLCISITKEKWKYSAEVCTIRLLFKSLITDQEQCFTTTNTVRRRCKKNRLLLLQQNEYTEEDFTVASQYYKITIANNQNKSSPLRHLASNLQDPTRSRSIINTAKQFLIYPHYNIN